MGATTSILGHKVDAKSVHGDDGLGNISIPEAPPPSDTLQSEHAVQALIRLANEQPHKITLVAIGPLTNVALAMRLDPMFTSKLKEMVIMGGNIKGKLATQSFFCKYIFVAKPPNNLRELCYTCSI